jgi:hypothetical protein
VQLHAVQEISKLFQDGQEEDSVSEHSDVDAYCHMILSQEAMSASYTSKTLKFIGNIQGHEVVILVDSRSTHSFVSERLVPMLLGVLDLPRAVSVQVANGQFLRSGTQIQKAEWSIQGHVFVTDLKVLPLPYYDVIVRIDWLEAHSIMKIDWLNKWIILNYADTAIQLHGMQPSLHGGAGIDF